MGESSDQATTSRMPADSGQSAVAPENGVTPLMKACQGENVKDVKTLLDQGDDVSERDASGRTALHYCVDNTTSQVAELLVTSDQTLLTSADSDGLTPLHLAVMAGNAVLVRFLLQKGAPVTTVDGEGHGIVHWAIVCKHVELIDALCASGADVAQPDVYQAAPLHYAAQLAGIEPKLGMRAIAKLLSRRTSVECRDNQQRTPLLWAASAGCADACAVLLKAGANVEAADKDGLTAMHCAASRGHVTCVAVLLRRGGAEVDSLDKYGCTPLFYAITLDHVDCVRFLLDKYANPNHQDNRGRSPAHCAAAKGSCTSLKLLKQKKCNLWVASNKGEYPIHEAALASHTAAVRFLLNENKHQVNVANQDGRTCLHIAALTNNLDLCRLLVAGFNADRNLVMTSKGERLTPYDAAMMKGSKECAEYLRQHGGISIARSRWLAEHGYTAADDNTEDNTSNLLSNGDSDGDDFDDVDGTGPGRGTASARARRREERRRQVGFSLGADNDDVTDYEFGEGQGLSRKDSSSKQNKSGDGKAGGVRDKSKSRGGAEDIGDEDNQSSLLAGDDSDNSGDNNSLSGASKRGKRRKHGREQGELDDSNQNQLAGETDASLDAMNREGICSTDAGGVAGAGDDAGSGKGGRTGAGAEGNAAVEHGAGNGADAGFGTGGIVGANRSEGDPTDAGRLSSNARTETETGSAVGENSRKSGATEGEFDENGNPIQQSDGLSGATQNGRHVLSNEANCDELGNNFIEGTKLSQNEDTDGNNLDSKGRLKGADGNDKNGECSDSDEVHDSGDEQGAERRRRKRRAKGGKGLHGDDTTGTGADGNDVNSLSENEALNQSQLTASQLLAQAQAEADKACKEGESGEGDRRRKGKGGEGEGVEEGGDVIDIGATLTNAQDRTADNTLDEDDVDLSTAMSKQQKRSNIRWVFFDTDIDKGTQTEDWLIKFSRSLAVGLTPDDPVCADRDKLPLSYAERDTLLMKLGDRGLGGRERRSSKASCATSEATYTGPGSVKGTSDSEPDQHSSGRPTGPDVRSAHDFADAHRQSSVADAEKAVVGGSREQGASRALQNGKNSDSEASAMGNSDTENLLENNLSSTSGDFNRTTGHHQQLGDGRSKHPGLAGRCKDNTQPIQKSHHHPHHVSTTEKSSNIHGGELLRQTGSDSTLPNTAPTSGTNTADTLSLNEGDDDVFTPRHYSTPHAQDDDESTPVATPVAVVVDNNLQDSLGSSFQTQQVINQNLANNLNARIPQVMSSGSSQAIRLNELENSQHEQHGYGDNDDRIHANSEKTGSNSMKANQFDEELNGKSGSVSSKKYSLTKLVDSEGVGSNKSGAVKSNQEQVLIDSERRSTSEDPINVKRYKLVRNEVVKGGMCGRTYSTGEKQGADPSRDHQETVSRKSSISKDIIDTAVPSHQQHLYSNQLGGKPAENSPIVAKLESIIAKVPELMADSGTNPEQPDGRAPTELKAIAHSKRANFLRMIVSHGYDRILPSSKTRFKPGRPRLHYRPGGGVGTEASDHLQPTKHRKDKSCQTPAYLDRLPRPRSAQPRRSPPIIQLPERPSTAPLTRKALRRKEHDRLLELYRMFGLEKRLRSNSTTSTIATSVVSKRPPRAVKLIPAKKCQNEIQELVRIFENKRLTTKEMFHARQLKMKNQYATKKASDKLLVKRLVTDYNSNSIYDRHSTAEFEKVVDFQTVLLGKLQQTLLDEKIMHEGRWVPDNNSSKLPTIGQKVKNSSKQSKSITPSPPPSGPKLNGSVPGATHSRTNMRQPDTAPTSSDVTKVASSERKPQLPRLTLKPLQVNNYTRTQLVAHKPPISRINNGRNPVAVLPQR